MWLTLLVLGCSENVLNNLGEPPPPGTQPGELVPSTIEETFEQSTARASDILFVVDDSGSMGGEQENLIANFDQFSQFLFGSDVDFRIGIVRLGLEDGPDDGRLVGVPPYITPETEFGALEFEEKVRDLGTSGASTCESGLQASYLALTEPLTSGPNQGFLRDDALLTVVVISDENDNGTLTWCDWPTARPDAWAPWFEQVKGTPSRVNFGVIAGFDPADHRTPANCSSVGLGDADAAANYGFARDLVGGISWSICDEDWSPVMTDLGLLAAGLTRIFPLSRIPVWDDDDWDGDGNRDEPVLEVWLDRGNGFVSIEPVWSDTPDPQNPWDYDGSMNAVVFTVQTMPAEGWSLRVSYPNDEEL